MTTAPQVSPDPGKDTRIVDVKGHPVVVRKINEIQFVLMAREAKILDQADVDTARKMTAMGRIFDILESAVVQEDDRRYLMGLVTAGNLELSDLLGFITVFTVEEAPKVRRGRPVRAR